MLCPAHSHVQFPHEKSRSKKQDSQKHPVLSHLYVCISVICYFSYMAIDL